MIDVASIERELTSLWKQAGEDGDDGGVIRACMLNLLVYVSQAEKLAQLDDILADITASHPCRALLILAEHEATTPSLAAEVTSRCTLPTSKSKQVCCEQVTLRAGAAQINEIPSAVAPLLLSDLPVYFWWRDVPKFSDRLFRRLSDTSDRVIIDSAQFEDPHNDLLNLATVLKESSRTTSFSDLNWVRLTAWRGLLAGFYDVPDYRQSLDRLDHLTVEYAIPGQDGSLVAPRALLLAGWLASRLGWKLGSRRNNRDGMAFEFNAHQRRVIVEFLVTENPSIEAGRIARATLSSKADTTASFAIKRSEDRSRIETEVALGDKRKTQRVLSYENWSEAALIGRELEIEGHDRVYERAVLAAAEMVAAL
jgi:glucose-6-phosphate dehydrogenase assembly protein OpcA